jgi:tetratricopeptide (TPR) repeat protein
MTIMVATLFNASGFFQQGRNSIEGLINTTDNRTLENVRVFLLNDGYSQLKQIYADGSGRYQFKGLAAGDYYVQVEPAGTGYERQTQRVEVNPFTIGRRPGAEIFRVDFVLKPERAAKKTTAIEKGIIVSNGLIFYQEVPAAAKEAYQRGMQSLNKFDLRAAEVDLVSAIKLFPDYYDALEALGSEYVKHSFFDSATPLLTHAIEINKNGWRAYYALGISFIEANRRADGLEALRRAVALNPDSINAGMRLGLELAKDNNSRNEAIKLLTNVTHMAGKKLPQAYLILASIYIKNNQNREAADALEAYLNSSPDSAQRESIKRKIEDLRRKARKGSSLAESRLTN